MKQRDRESCEGLRTLWLALGLFLLLFFFFFLCAVSKRHSAQKKERLREMSQKITSAWSKSKDDGDEENPQH